MASRDPDSDQGVATIRHRASEKPWVDGDIHYHSESEEYYLLLRGELQLLVEGSVFTLRPDEILQVKPRTPRAIVGGSGQIELFVLRALAPEDRHSIGPVPLGLSPTRDESERDFTSNWGCRASLMEEHHQNCWLFGIGRAHYNSDNLCLAYMNLPTAESVNTSRASHNHHLHIHKESFEYYAVLMGSQILRIEDDFVEVNEGEIVEVPPNVRHVEQATNAPFERWTKF